MPASLSGGWAPSGMIGARLPGAWAMAKTNVPDVATVAEGQGMWA